MTTLLLSCPKSVSGLYHNSEEYKVSGGYTIKRKARVEHECHDCGCLVEPGEEYYQLTLRGFHNAWITKPICERCWKDRQLKA